MTLLQSALLCGAGALAGALNALAGGGGFVTLPALMWAGCPPILANTGGTVAVWPGLLSALYAYRRNLRHREYPMGTYLGLAVFGSAVGAGLLLFTTNSFFLALLPWLLLFATVLLIAGRRITDRISAWRGTDDPLPPSAVLILLFLIAVYGGYFGGGMGIMTLAVLTLIGMRDMHEMNALKTLLSAVINSAGVAIFIATGKVPWAPSLAMTAGCVAGGYLAGHWVQKVDQAKVRTGIGILAAGMTAWFFWKAYAP